MEKHINDFYCYVTTYMCSSRYTHTLYFKNLNYRITRIRYLKIRNMYCEMQHDKFTYINKLGYKIFREFQYVKYVVVYTTACLPRVFIART